MGLEDTVYKEGTVSSKKSLDDITLPTDRWEILIEQQITDSYDPSYLFNEASDEEVKAVIEYIDGELSTESPFGYSGDGINAKARAYRKKLLDILID